MSHKASPWENGGCESWMKTLKYEELFRQEYRDLAEAHTCMQRFIDNVYDQQRLHSALETQLHPLAPPCAHLSQDATLSAIQQELAVFFTQPGSVVSAEAAAEYSRFERARLRDAQ